MTTATTTTTTAYVSDYTALDGVEGIYGVADAGTNTETEWDFARYSDATMTV